MSIADQVAGLENDHAIALVTIDALNSKNRALTDTLAAMTIATAAAEARLFQLKMHADGMTAMLEKVASAALDAVKVARSPVGTPLEVAQFAPRPKILVAESITPSVGRLADPLVTDETPPPARRAVAERAATDAAPERLNAASPEPHWPPIVEQASRVDRIKRGLLPALGLLVRRPVDHVRHDPAPTGLPMFLRRDTVFKRAA